MTVLEYLRSNRILLDGGMGTLLQERGLAPGEAPERWNISHSDLIEEIHLAYYDAGSNVVNTNTFGANALHFSHRELEEIINLSDRIAVIFKGQIQRTLGHGEATQRKLGMMMAGVKEI